MSKPKTNRDGYQKVLKAITKARLADSLEISRQAVGNWGHEVPEAWAYRVSIITSVPIAEILPEVAPDVHRKLKEIALEKTKARQASEADQGANGG